MRAILPLTQRPADTSRCLLVLRQLVQITTSNAAPSSSSIIISMSAPSAATERMQHNVALPYRHDLASGFPQQQSFFQHVHQQLRGFTSSPAPCASDDKDLTPSSSSSSGNDARTLKLTLQEALMRLVDAAVEMVEADKLDEAIDMLKDGIRELEGPFGDSAELGELHNQVALLLLMQGKTDESAHHAQIALDTTKRHFGDKNLLTGHRLLRLGTAKFGQGRLSEAADLLLRGTEVLGEDASAYEAKLYLDLIQLSGATDAGEVHQLDGRLESHVRSMRDKFGVDSMILSMALAQHNRVLLQALAAAAPDVPLCEALLKQHARLLESLNPNSEDLAITYYKLGTFYYANDILPDAHAYLRKASKILMTMYPEDHDLMVLCKHRLGMVCAASGDHRSASQLLTASQAHFLKGEDAAAAPLAEEARLGLAFAKVKAAGAREGGEARAAALQEARQLLDNLAKSIGTSHMLTQAGMKYYAQMNVMSKHN